MVPFTERSSEEVGLEEGMVITTRNFNPPLPLEHVNDFFFFKCFWKTSKANGNVKS